MPLELAVTLGNLEETISDAFADVIAAESLDAVPVDTFEQMTTAARRWGIGHLLMSGDVDTFVAGLYKSARTWVVALGGATNRSGEELYPLCCSRALPLLDAVAIADWSTAAGISATCPARFHADMEQEHEFAFFDLVMALSTGAGRETLEAKLQRLETSVVQLPDESSHASMCSALIDGDEPGFWEALEHWLTLEHERYQEILLDPSTEPEVRHIEAHLSVEGLALRRLAEIQGFCNGEPEFPMLPSLVLPATLQKHPQDDPWPEIVAMLESR